mgnify:CR=1 FL=1
MLIPQELQLSHDHVIDTCDKYGITMAFTGVRLFHH